MELFRKLNDEGVTIVQVTHSDKNASYGKRVIQLAMGGSLTNSGRNLP
jgi:ABC-type antimicrobial peptide transport system, ATPase component